MEPRSRLPPPSKGPYFGLDLSTSPRYPSAFAVLSPLREPPVLGSLRGDEEILQAVASCQPRWVAIDAPLSLPLEMDCLEEACPCRSALGLKGRLCERKLARLGIGCFYTTKRSIIKAMVYRAIALKQRLEAAGWRVMEVYPYATKFLLWGRPPRKTTPQGQAWLKERLQEILPALSPEPWDHHRADALLGAYTAYLYDQGKAVSLGHPQEGLIYTPSPYEIHRRM